MIEVLWPRIGTVEVHKRGKVFVVRYIDQKQCRAYRTRLGEKHALFFASLFGQEVITCYEKEK